MTTKNRPYPTLPRPTHFRPGLIATTISGTSVRNRPHCRAKNVSSGTKRTEAQPGITLAATTSTRWRPLTTIVILTAAPATAAISITTITVATAAKVIAVRRSAAAATTVRGRIRTTNVPPSFFPRSYHAHPAQHRQFTSRPFYNISSMLCELPVHWRPISMMSTLGNSAKPARRCAPARSNSWCSCSSLGALPPPFPAARSAPKPASC